MDGTTTLTKTYINAGIWSKNNKFLFQISDKEELEMVLDHKYAGSHPHAISVKEVLFILVENIYKGGDDKTNQILLIIYSFCSQIREIFLLELL